MVDSAPGVDGTDDAAIERSSLDERLGAIERELSGVVGDASLCAISRSAGSVPGAKYLEGRRAAAVEVRRAMRSGRSLTAIVEDRLSVWRAELELSEERSMGADWRAYRAGGVDELDSLAADC
jgi:hypothetical protein